jgi:hypothetical protein
VAAALTPRNSATFAKIAIAAISGKRDIKFGKDAFP